MPAKLQEIEGRFLGERFRFGDCLIGTVELTSCSIGRAEAVGHQGTILTVKGDADVDELECRQTYRFYGRFSDYRNKRTGELEKQFHFQTFVPARSHDREGVIAYLERAGKGCGMGRGTAAKLWERFQSEAVREIRENPSLLLEVNSRISTEQAQRIGARLAEQAATEDAMIELTNLLIGRGFPKATARKAIAAWGNRAAMKVRRDPYALMRFRGCGFKLCDALWIELGLPKNRLRRQGLCAWYAIASSSEGDTWFHRRRVEHAVRAMIPNADFVRAVKFAVRLGRRSPNHYGALALRRTDGKNGPLIDGPGEVWLAEAKKATAEQTLAQLVTAAMRENHPRSITSFETVETEYQEAITAVCCRRCGQQLTAPEVHVWNGLPFGPTCIGYISDGTDVEVFPLDEWIARQPPMVRKAVSEVPSGRIELPSQSLWPDAAAIQDIDDHQRQTLAEALVAPVVILGGSPGTGKTYTTAQLIKALLRSGQVGPYDIAIGAPTGKAAVRLTETMQAAGLKLRARTWHSLLGAGTHGEEGGEWTFLHHERNRWPFRVIIGDESSMLDTNLMRSVFAARPRGCHVLLVGDVNQLPPVGHGAPLRDLIAADVPYAELREIKRNSGGIVEACAAIRDGQPWSEGSNLRVTGSPKPKHQIAAMMASIRSAERDGVDPVWGCQVLCAVNGRSPLARKPLNAYLQDQLNAGPSVYGSPFRKADKIVCNRNGRYTLYHKVDGAFYRVADRLKGIPGAGAYHGDEFTVDDNGEVRVDDQGQVYIANGELAEVLEIREKLLFARLSSPQRIVSIPMGKPSEKDDEGGAGCNWELGYALSVHKSQGSEWPVSIVMLDEYPGARMVCSREWLYTAISRAKSQCVLVGQKHVADAMCRRVAIDLRKTFLRELVQLAEAEHVLESLL